MSNLLILMSGGTTPVINSTLIGILKVLKKKRIKVFSGMPGLDGVLNDQFLNLSNLSQTKIRLLRNTPGSHFTGTSRLKKLTNCLQNSSNFGRLVLGCIDADFCN